MRYLFLFYFVIISAAVSAQHCPWDCDGMILIKTDAGKSEMKKLDPVLVDINKQLILDTSKGSDIYDLCRVLYYDDFLKIRIDGMGENDPNSYRYDTAYHFAKNHYVVKFNYCTYSREDEPTELFVRYNDAAAATGYSYIPVPSSRRIDLHQYNRAINTGATAVILKAVQPFILTISRKEFGLL